MDINEKKKQERGKKHARSKNTSGEMLFFSNCLLIVNDLNLPVR